MAVRIRSFWFLLLAGCASLVATVHGQAQPPRPTEPEVAIASDEGERALAGFQLPEGWRGQLFAAEPLLANPVAFYVDDRGRVFVCETFRQSRGVTDNRDHDERWLDDDLAARTVADRRAYHRRQLGDKFSEFTRYDDRLRLVEDTDGDGRADQSQIFADRFNDIVDGTGAGVLVRGQDVFFTCIPHLWRLRDRDGNARADERISLHSGFGVRVAFRGHDLHGLIVGPDGKLYFSVGDRGYHVETQEGTFADPESGAVFRCQLDGSQLEVVHTGLRNPQELAFDDYGNLFTGDNNSDSGDKARWVHLVEGGDSGWRMAFQYLPDRGPWNREQLWHPHHEGQAAYIVPPVANFADGPSGLAFYPGTGLSPHFQGRFFLCDFRGTPANSGVRTFRVRPRGASFELVDAEQSIWKLLSTDVQFGPDGGVYVSDWVNGWDGEGKGRIYRFVDPQYVTDPAVSDVKQLLSGGFTQRPLAELQQLLGHPDRRIRYEAQFALVDQVGSGGETHLQQTALSGAGRLARVHAIWGLGQLAARRRSQPVAAAVKPAIRQLLDDTDAEIRAQAAKVAGDLDDASIRDQLVQRLGDSNSRVRFFAALSLGRIGGPRAIDPLLQMLAQNPDADPLLRHAGTVGLARIHEPDELLRRSRSAPGASPATVRLAIVVALRKMNHSAVAEFLDDPDPRVVLEAARAIHDLPQVDNLPRLAALITTASTEDALLRRVLNANFRLGTPTHARAVAAFAARPESPENMRLEALDMLATWEAPSSRDRVLGMWRPLGLREKPIAVAALRESLDGIIAGPAAVRAHGADVAARLGIVEITPILHALLADPKSSGAVRVNALVGLERLQTEGLARVARETLSDADAEVRNAARGLLARLDPTSGVPALAAAVRADELVERQGALSTLASIDHAEVDRVLAAALDELIAGRIPADTQLDLLLAAGQRMSREVKARLELYEASRAANDSLAAYRETLHGGSAARGRVIFLERAQVGCLRCHKAGEYGGEVGPDLVQSAREWNQLGETRKREHLVESLIAPSAKIAKGFESVIVVAESGQIVTGVKAEEDTDRLVVVTAENKRVTIPRSEIDELTASTKSAMPDDLVKQLSKSDIRDLVEFLAQLK